MKRYVVASLQGRPDAEVLQRRANSIARKYGRNRATEVILGTEDRMAEYLPFGYRKYTTGQYVPNAYRRNFGWKNTYYQHAKVVVELKK